MKNKKTIFLAGHNGLIGKSIYKILKLNKIKVITASRKKLDLKNQSDVLKFFKSKKIDSVIIAAAKVGGIYTNNTHRAEFIYDNLMIQNNIINSAYLKGIKDLIFLGSSCVYPKFSKQPIKENELLSGYLEFTNEPYAVAKIAGIKMCENYSYQYNLNYKSLMPCNSFGENDNFDNLSSHFLPALIKKIAVAKKNNKNEIELWGNGKALREVIHSEEIANACIFFLYKKTKEKIINVGSGYEKTILNYAKLIMKVANHKCKIIYKNKNLTGTPRKILNSKLAKKYGWKLKNSTKDKINETYKNFEKKLFN
jgi:GDP-L-fucose synthase